jgi:CBS domain-containing protein
MYNHIPLSAIMTKELVTLKPEDTLETVELIFATHKFRHLPVVDEAGRLLGMISKTDFLALSDGLAFFRSEEEQKRDLLFLQSMRAEEVMVKGLIKLGPDDTASFAARIFKNQLFHALPVVDADDKLLGMVSTIDLMSYAYQ